MKTDELLPQIQEKNMYSTTYLKSKFYLTPKFKYIQITVIYEVHLG